MPKAVITGASKGVGNAIARRFPKNVQIIDISRSSGYDLSQPDGIEDAMEVLEIEKPDILILNHGMWDNWDTDREELINTNLTSSLILADNMLNIWSENDIKGHLFLILSNSAHEGFSGNEWYSATKAALFGWARCAIKTVKQLGIKITCISPGTINTSFWKDAPVDNREKCNPIEPWEIADLVYACYITKSCVFDLRIEPMCKEELHVQ